MLRDHRCRSKYRFIPTRVGNSYSDVAAAIDTAVHPHTGGELALTTRACLLRGGSSPHGWGTPSDGKIPTHRERFIPTRVGNSRDTRTGASARTVHPHTGGELRGQLHVAAAKSGSSPHGWGTLFQTYPPSHMLRFIPTRVGNSRIRENGKLSLPVHPHTGGELLGFLALAVVPLGSSPHGWGTQL